MADCHPQHRVFQFVQSTEDTPLSSRQRASVACVYCRSRKVRCDGYELSRLGRCTNCARRGQKCVFAPVVSTEPPLFLALRTIQQHLKNDALLREQMRDLLGGQPPDPQAQELSDPPPSYCERPPSPPLQARMMERSQKPSPIYTAHEPYYTLSEHASPSTTYSQTSAPISDPRETLRWVGRQSWPPPEKAEFNNVGMGSFNVRHHYPTEPSTTLSSPVASCTSMEYSPVSHFREPSLTGQTLSMSPPSDPIMVDPPRSEPAALAGEMPLWRIQSRDNQWLRWTQPLTTDRHSGRSQYATKKAGGSKKSSGSPRSKVQKLAGAHHHSHHQRSHSLPDATALRSSHTTRNRMRIANVIG